MKNIILIIFALVLGVVGTWAQTALPDASATLVSGTIYTATTKTINGTLTVPTGGTVTIYIPAGVTLTINGANAGNGYNGNIGDESPRKSHSHNSTCAGNGGKENACGGAGGNGAMPAICVPTGATLILTGEGTLIATGGNAGSGGNGGKGQDANGTYMINYYGGAGGAGAGGGGGAAAAIGGAGGHGGAGGYGGEYGANAFLGIVGPGSGGEGGDGISGTSGQAMGNVWIIGNVTVETTNGNGSTEAAQISNGTQGTSGAIVFGWIPSLFSGRMQFFGGNGGNFGYGGSAATYGIGGGGNGGDGGHGGHGGDIFRESEGAENESNKSQSYTPGSAGNGTLYVQQYTSINEPDITGTTHGTVNPITTDAQMPSAIATTFTIDGESTPLRSIFYGTVIEDMELTAAEKEVTRTGYTFNGYKIKGTSTAVYDANGIFVYPITKVASSTDNTQYVSLQAPGNIVLEAVWTANIYTVQFDKQSGSGGTASVNATYDSAMPSAEAPTRTGYTFGGYYSEPNGGGTQYYDADMSSTHNWDINTNQNTLYAKWTVKQYTVNLDKQGGTGGTSSVTVNYDSAMPSATAPSRTGYTFKGYYSEQNGGGTQYYAEDMNSAHNWDIDTNPSTLYAKWEANKCTINLDKQGGSGGTAYVTGTYDSAMPSATAPSRTGYTFAGYYTSPNGGGTQYYDENMVSVNYWNITTNPSTLYANWTANTYTLNFDVQNGDALSPSTQSVTYDAAYGTLPTPTRYGFAFKGWYTTPNGGSETDTEVLTSDIYSIDGDQTIYAHWNTIVVDIDAYSAETQLAGNYFRTFYDSQIAHILPTGVKAYKGKIEGNNLVLTAIEAKDDDDNDIIPKNVPVILRMMPNEEAGVPIPGDLYQIKTKQISLTTSESELTIDNTDNELIGSDIVIATAVANSYILSFGSNGLGFYEWSTHPLEAHKAYVIKDSANPAKALTFRFEEDVTGINETIKDFMFNDSNMVIYNLNGIRLSKPQKGLNIINGRKVWVK